MAEDETEINPRPCKLVDAMSLRMSALNTGAFLESAEGGYAAPWKVTSGSEIGPAKLRSLRTPDMGLCSQQFLSSAVSQVWGGAPGLARLTSLDAAGLGPHSENQRFK